MPPRRRAAASPPPLTDADVAKLREQVAADEKPRVAVRTASSAVAAGTRGTVVRFGDPKDNEYVVVRLGRDEVPFAPNELSLTGRAATIAAKAAAGAAVSAASAVKPTAPTRAVAKSEPRPTSASQPVMPSRKKAATRTRPTRKSARSSPPLTVTLHFSNGEWTVAAARGARRLSRPVPLRPGAVSAFAEHVDEVAVRDALVETVESCRAVVEEKAAALREELKAAEAALKDYDAKPGRR